MRKSTTKQKRVEYRYYVIPENEQVLGLLGEGWRREYGEGLERLHFHNYFEAGLCYEGTGKVVHDDRIYDFAPGNIMILPPNVPHTTQVERGTTAFWEWVYFDIEAVVREMYPAEEETKIREIIESLYQAPLLLTKESHPTIYKVIELIMDEIRQKRSMYRENIRSLTRILIVEVLRIRETTGKKTIHVHGMVRVRPAIEYVHVHYMDEIKTADLADACNVSESHFRRLFLQCMNMKPLDYVNYVRVENACELLKKTELTMPEIAYTCGFGNVTTLTRNFKKLLNSTPYQWQRSAENHELKLRRYNISAYKGWE